MRKFFEELKRRNVFRVGVAYATVAWILWQVAAQFEETFNFPSWFDATVIVLLFIGSPFALILAWVYEMTPEGVKKTADLDRDSSVSSKKSVGLDRIIVGGLVIAVVFLLFDRFFSDIPTHTDDGNMLSTDSQIEESLGSEEDSSEFVSDRAWRTGCTGQINQSLTAVLIQARNLTNAEEYFEGRCVAEPGWEFIVNGAIGTDPNTGAKFVRGNFEPSGVAGTVYLIGIQNELGNKQLLRAVGQISYFRLAGMGRNPSTGESIEIPTTIYLVGTLWSKESPQQMPVKLSPLTNQDLDDLVLMLVSLYFGKPVRDITGEERFEEDFVEDSNPIPGVGDVRIIELIIALEEYAPCTIPDDVVEEADTVNKLRLAAAMYCETQ